MSIRGHSLWFAVIKLSSLLEKPFGGVHIAGLAEHGINQIAVAVDGTVEVVPLPPILR